MSGTQADEAEVLCTAVFANPPVKRQLLQQRPNRLQEFAPVRREGLCMRAGAWVLLVCKARVKMAQLCGSAASRKVQASEAAKRREEDSAGFPEISFTSGFIFRCSSQTLEECMTRYLFGSSHWDWDSIKQIGPETAVFLYDTSKKILHGIFVATEKGMNLEPGAWDGRFPAQARVRVWHAAPPLPLQDVMSVVGGKKRFKTFLDAETSEGQDQAQLLVDDVLERIKDSDSGSALSKEEQSEVNDRLDELETFSDKKPLDDERIYGSYNVTYVSAGKSEKSNPAGGRFRGKLGKSLFRTTVLEQNVYEPDIILNKVGFRLFGIIPGEVTLKGTIEPEPADQRATVRAKFGSPKIKLGFVTLSFGPKSSVVLTTTYLDDRVRLGKGSRGSYFIFTRFSPTESSV
eukprot:gene3380-4254_t